MNFKNIINDNVKEYSLNLNIENKRQKKVIVINVFS